ncbi:MAG: hypothetical protein HY473_01825 [Candidatus Sungbacteria bacterium]|uniref:Uncharacterized protein n=1 Tax=Candidatus Sungiibacteriota bacterium TaxID=2750080 RepID=A0A933DTE7_9BACT|nr:hypothetical protein [Candidatus Sungbacteria bacterium]
MVFTTSAHRRARNWKQELRRHSTFVEDGRRLFTELLQNSHVLKAKTGSVSGRSSRKRQIVLREETGWLLITLKNTDGHQQFRVSVSAGTAPLVRQWLSEKFSEYEIITRTTEGEG